MKLYSIGKQLYNCFYLYIYVEVKEEIICLPQRVNPYLFLSILPNSYTIIHFVSGYSSIAGTSGPISISCDF